MACPFATVAAVSGLVVGAKLLLFRDRYRRFMWLGLIVAGAGWTLYALNDRPVWLRYALEVEGTILLLAMIARLVWILRVDRQRLEAPRWVTILYSRLRPLVVHPVSLALKGVLLVMLSLDWTGWYDATSFQYQLVVGALLGWLLALGSWKARGISFRGTASRRTGDVVTGGDPAGEDLHTQLRRETHDVHERLESGVAVNARMVERMDSARLSPEELSAARERYREVYVCYLIGAYGFERALEVAIDSTEIGRLMHARLGLKREPGPPSQLIRRDFEEIASDGSEASLVPMPHLPPLNTLARTVGAEYVRRGSRMGGAVLARVVNHNLGYDGESGARFLNLHGRDVRSHFMEFCQSLNRYGSDAADRAEVVSAAQEIFAAVFDWQKSLERRFLRGAADDVCRRDEETARIQDPS